MDVSGRIFSTLRSSATPPTQTPVACPTYRDVIIVNRFLREAPHNENLRKKKTYRTRFFWRKESSTEQFEWGNCLVEKNVLRGKKALPSKSKPKTV